MNQKELDVFRQMLQEKKENILKEVQKNREAHNNFHFNDVGDSADIASDSYEKEFLFELTDKEQRLLNNIEAALRKIEHKNYGVCEECKGKISSDRLKAVPFALLCVSCQSKKEAGS
ncbi:MAG: TraR/DksA family transcriptional regulator [bacterium]